MRQAPGHRRRASGWSTPSVCAHPTLIQRALIQRTLIPTARPGHRAPSTGPTYPARRANPASLPPVRRANPRIHPIQAYEAATT